MNTKQKVTSLELSKQLKEAGAKQESEYAWFEDRLMHSSWKENYKGNWYAAFDCVELLERLPDATKVWRYGKEYLAENGGEFHHNTEATTPADALGKFKLWCLMEGHCSE